MSYRSNPCPVPLHALDSALVAAMHREIKALHGLLLDAADSMGISPADTEKAIDYRVQQAKDGDNVREHFGTEFLASHVMR